ncbi:MAG: PAS domain-containing protein [Planctomycetota bacterium]|nr:PAS domain-containing protein [Planctomycetota bacterium]
MCSGRAATLATVVVLVIGLIATLTAVRVQLDVAERINQERLSLRASMVREQVLHKVDLLHEALVTTRAAFDASDHINRNEFDRLVASSRVLEHLESVVGIAFIRRVKRDELASFVDRVRESEPSFHVATSDNAAELWIVEYNRNRQDFPLTLGHDEAIDATRASMLEQARDSGQAVLSAPMTLRGVTDSSYDFNFAIPWYGVGTPLSVEERRDQLKGWLCLRIRTDALLGVISRLNGGEVLFQVSDVTSTPRTLESVQDNQSGHDSNVASPIMQHERLHVGGREWLITVRPGPAFPGIAPTKAYTLAIAGVGFTLLLAALIGSFGRSARRARELADTMTQDVRRLALVAERTTNVVIITDADRRTIWVNDAFTRVAGYERSELIGRVPGHLLQFEKTSADTVRRLRKALNAGEGFKGEILNRGKFGNEYWLDLEIQPLKDAEGRLTGFIAIESEVTERVRQRESLAEQVRQLEQAEAMAKLGHWSWDVKTNRVRWSKQIYQIHRRDPALGEPDYQGILQLYSPEAAARLDTAVRFAIETGTSYSLVLRTSDEEERYLEGTGHVRRNASGIAESLYGTVRDVTESVKQARELQAAKERAERALREAELLRNTLDKHAIFSVADARGRIVDINDNFCRISGYSREELIGQDHRILNSGVHPKSFWVELWRTLASGNAWHGEVCNRAKDGSLYWVDSIIAPSIGPDGKAERYVSIRTDITARKKAEAALAQREREIQAIVAATPGVLYRCLIDNRWTMLFISDEVRTLTGHEPEAFRAGSSICYADVIHPEDRDRVAGEIINATFGNGRFEITYRVVHSNGAIKHVFERGQVLLNADGKPDCLVGFIVDVSEQKLTQERLDMALRGAKAGLWDWDIPSGKTYFNDTFYSMLGYAAGELPMTIDTWNSLCHPDDLPIALEALDQHFRGECPTYRVEQRLRTKDGGWKWVLDAGEITERHADGSPKRMIGVHLDIQDLRQAREAAETATRSKSEFLANMSHEIRTPMTAILGYTDLLAEEGDSDADSNARREYVATIKRNGEHLLSLINDILDVSKIEAGKMSVELIDSSPFQIVHEVVSLMSIKAQSKGIQLEAVHETSLPETIRTDPVRLRQILVNLIGNAIKFTEIGGVSLRIGYTAASDQLRFEVVDTGIGMSPEQMSRLFGAFEQADASTTRRFGGTGLGLRISKRLAQMLGGDIVVTSELGKGSTFSLHIAAQPPAGTALVEATDSVKPKEIAPRPTTSANDSRLKGARVLLLEDGPDNVRLISFFLRRAGAEVIHAANGRLGIEALTRDGTFDAPLANPPRVDIVLTDIQMPEMDGYEVARTLRARGWTRAIIALTANAMSGDAERCLASGCNAYASKPVDRDALIELCVASMPHNLLAHSE